MTILKKTILYEHFLHPETIFGDNKPTRVNTILGSCVSVCLFDKILEHGAINHYMLPYWSDQGLPSPRYGNIAIKRLIEKMTTLGSMRTNIVAKIFGGADQHSNGSEGYQIGWKNVAIAESILQRENIPIIAQSTGGTVGRKIVFHTHTNRVWLKFLE